MTTFRADIRHWPTVAAFRAHLAQYDPAVCGWVKRVVLHHTVLPQPSGWRGLQSMRNLCRYYQGLGWDSGPHLFLCVGAPDPDDDGIFQLTPLSERAIHANACNADGIGIEVVGNYNLQPWPPALDALVLGTAGAFIHWRHLPRTAVVGHRDCGSRKTCPGRAINLDMVRARL